MVKSNVFPRKKSKPTPSRYSWSAPDKAIAYEHRVIIDTSGPVWSLPEFPGWKGANLHWDRVTLSVELLESIRAYIHHTIETKKLQTARNYFTFLADAMSVLPSEVTTIAHLTTDIFAFIREKLAQKFAHRRIYTAWATLRYWYQWMCDRGIPETDPLLARKLKHIKVKPPDNFLIIRQGDQEKGPLSDEEQYLIRQALKQRIGTLIERVCVGLADSLGARPIQIVLLREDDFHSTNGFYWVDVPLVKSREKASVPLPLPTELGEAIEELILLNKQRWPGKNNLHLIQKADGGGRGGWRIKPEPTNPGNFAQRLRKWAKCRAKIISPRTQRLLTLTPRRFRYTVATVLASQGTSARHISYMLTQKSEDSAQIYIDASSAVVERLDATLGANPDYKAAAIRFIGEVVEWDDSPGRNIYGTLPNLKNLGKIGSCGADFICQLQPPISCYACPKFQAFRNANHREMLHELKNLNHSGPIPDQLRMVIVACEACVQACGRNTGNEHECQ